MARFVVVLCASALSIAISQDSQTSLKATVAASECQDGECHDDDALHLLQKSAEVRRNKATVDIDQQALLALDLEVSTASKGSFGIILHHLKKMVADTTQTCSEKFSNPVNYKVGLIIPSIFVFIFAAGTYWLSVRFPRPPASEQAYHKITRVDADGYPVHINWHFVWWSGLGIGMANVNYVVVLPIAVEDFSGSMVMAGLWVGLYALGALICMPLFVKLGHTWVRTAFVVHGVTTLIGNLIMIYGAIIESMPMLMFGRVTTGLAFGIYYTCNQGCLALIPTWDRLEAIFISRCVYSIGFAMGPCISPICNYVLTDQPFIRDIFPNYRAAAEGTPLILMAIYGLTYTLLALFYFTEMEELDAETEGLGVGSTTLDPTQNQATYEDKKTAVIMFSSTVFTNFTRNFIRVLWETGTLIILARQYCIATGAGIIVSIVAVTLVVSRNAMAKLGIACKGDNALLMRILEWGGACSLPFMFLYGMKPNGFTLSIFLIGGIIFYNANASQSGVLLALGGEAAIPGNFWLDKVALNTYIYISMLVAYIFGPVCTFVMQDLFPGQNTVAILVGIVTFLQIGVTYGSVRPRKDPNAPATATDDIASRNSTFLDTSKAKS